MTEATYFRRGFGLKSEIAGVRSADYHSHLIEALRAGGHRLAVGRLTFRLAKEFGFCYGVDRAVDYAYESRLKFPDRRLFLVGEIIHNPHVNAKLEAMGVEFLRRPDGSTPPAARCSTSGSGWRATPGTASPPSSTASTGTRRPRRRRAR
jgi:hypothetical protein